jgi:hypothetical protein
MRHVRSNDEDALNIDKNLEDQGEVLRSGAIYGLEHIVLTSLQGLKNVVVSSIHVYIYVYIYINIII